MSERFKPQRFAEILKQRDEVENAPEWYFEQVAKHKYVEANKDAIQIEFEEYNKFSMELLGNCTKSCIQHTTSSVITTGESECLSNCYSKGQEVGALMRLFNTNDDIKRYGGFQFKK